MTLLSVFNVSNKTLFPTISYSGGGGGAPAQQPLTACQEEPTCVRAVRAPK